MSKIILFLVSMIQEVKKDDLISVANDLTYKILLSLFPFLTFLMALLGYFDLETEYLLNSVKASLPAEIMDIIAPFAVELLDMRRPDIVGVSLAAMIFSASSGFNTVMKGINKAYGQKDQRNFFTKRFVSVILVFIFALSIITSMVMLIFNDNIFRFALKHMGNRDLLRNIFGILGYIITIGVLFFCVLLINWLSLARKDKLKKLLPGSLLTVVCWLLVSKGFNLYITNYSKYSAIYGSVAGIMILMIWLNLISITLLVGAEVNAVIKIE